MIYLKTFFKSYIIQLEIFFHFIIYKIQQEKSYFWFFYKRIYVNYKKMKWFGRYSQVLCYNSHGSHICNPLPHTRLYLDWTETCAMTKATNERRSYCNGQQTCPTSDVVEPQTHAHVCKTRVKRGFISKYTLFWKTAKIKIR